MRFRHSSSDIVNAKAPTEHLPATLGPLRRVLARISRNLATGRRLAVSLRLSPITAGGGLRSPELCLKTLERSLEVSHLHSIILFETLQSAQIPETFVVLLA